MRSTVVAILFLAGYLGIEAYAIKRAGERTEPEYIYRMLVKSEIVATFCQQVDPSLVPKFERTLTRVLARYKRELSEEEPNLTPEEVDTRVTTVRNNVAEAVTPQLAPENCNLQEQKDEARRYQIYANKSRY